MEKLNIAFCSFPDFSSNAKALYSYMSKRYQENMNFIWMVESDSMVQKLKSIGIEVYKIGTEEYYEATKKVDVFFTTHCNILGEKNERSVYFELWHGIGSKHLGYLSDYMTEENKDWFIKIRKNVDFFIVPTDFWRVIFSTAFNVEYSRVLPLGYPKLDYFITTDSKKNLSRVLKKDLESYAKVIYYMPTFHKGCGLKQESFVNTENIFNFSKYDEEKVISFLKEKNYLLCIKRHPSEEIKSNDITDENICSITDDMLLNSEISINEILGASDMLITDYSSLGVEYTFLSKPVIYCVNDLEEYSKNRGIIFNNFNFWALGDKVTSIDELLNSIEKNIYNNQIDDKSFDRKKLWFGDLSDGGCSKICDYIFEDNKISDRIKNYTLPYDKDKIRVQELSHLLDEKNEVIKNREERIKELDEFIAQIINSKGWQFLEKLRKFKKIIKK